MRRSIILLSFCVLFGGGVAAADLNLDDFDDDLMDNMDDAYKDLEAVIPAHNAASAKLEYRDAAPRSCKGWGLLQSQGRRPRRRGLVA